MLHKFTTIWSKLIPIYIIKRLRFGIKIQYYQRLNHVKHIAHTKWTLYFKQGKSEGFDCCGLAILLKLDSNRRFFQPLKFDGWPRKIIGHIFYLTSSFVHHLKPLGELKLDLQSGNARFGSKLAILCPVWPWNLMDDLEKHYGTSSMLY